MSSSPSKVRWGVLGYARIAREAVIPAILRSSNSAFHAIASRQMARSAECQGKFGCAKVYADYEALLQDPEVDAVYIPLPNSLHREWTLKAAEHGKHVLCEKPIGLNAAECREMMSVCSARGVLLMEAFMYRYTDCTRKVREILRSGVLSEIRQVNSTFRFLLANPASIKLQESLGGGALYDVGCYPVNFTGMVVDEVLRIRGENTAGAAPALPEAISVQCVRDRGVDMLFSALLRYPGGIIAAIHCGFNAQKQIESQIIGSAGVLSIPNTFLGEASAMALSVDGVVRSTIPVEESDRYRLEVEDFAAAIQQKRPPQFALAETLRNMEVMDRLFAASR